MRTIYDGVTRLRAEYLEMPGLRLQRAQIERLCGIESSICELVLEALVGEHFLYRTSGGHYARVTDGDVPRPSGAKPSLRESKALILGSAL